MGKTELIFVIDREKDCAFYFKFMDNKHIHITKRRTFLKTVSILDNVYNTKPLIEEIEVPELSTELRIGYWGYNYDPATDCLYICTHKDYRVDPNTSYLVTEIKMDTWKVKQYEVTNTTDKYLRSDNNWQMFVTDGYLYVKGYDSPYELYKIQITNPANVVKFKRTNASSVNGLPKFVINGRIYYENGNEQLLIANTATNEINLIKMSRPMFFFPFSISLMCEVEICRRSARSAWLNFCTFLASLIRAPTSLNLSFIVHLIAY